ncbi:uncharacterized protein N7473_009321 [Penicillium subrubescens]|uniref:Cenp-O kinetochore centromere component n=1 Tax=Penicillium subrubescens TaxID=1316194 RepID=A0A1Q5TAQ5_9EURO|nr:uncharacterized protein N7473_009321 [Penicillium subrubescens]KAJ5886647.1 hypothetical protein N7473_009321 [Penicillium subrubescens]OKO97315.1 hypothetical protein PENSUB_10109 [Penicillium subrubescens]
MVFPARDASASPDPHEQHLDTDIQSIRAEIRTLQRRKRFLTSSLLSSDSIQKFIRKPPPTLLLSSTSIADEVSPLVRAAGKHSDSNHHRIAFGTTAFPFKDPGSVGSSSLLGVRIDVCVRGGRFAKPYYVLLKSERVKGEKERRLRVYRHTVPAFIDIARVEGVYLSFPGSGKSQSQEGDSDDEAENSEALKGARKSGRRQDLRGFVRELRRELVAWHLRSDAIELLREKLGLSEEEAQIDPAERLSPEARGGIVALAATAVEARYVRLEWEDGRVGRFKLSNGGIVERAVVIGDDGRDKQMEDAMTGGGGRVETLLERLRERGAVAA